MLEAVRQLKEESEALPQVPTMEDAERVKFSLSKFHRELTSWPAGKEPELADASWRMGLVGLSAGVFCMFGAPALVGAGVGAMFFGSKHLEQGAKAVKSLQGVKVGAADSEA